MHQDIHQDTEQKMHVHSNILGVQLHVHAQRTMKQERNIALNKLFLFETEYSDGFVQKIL